MEVIGNEWIMKCCDWSSPECVHSAEELVGLIEAVGFLPLFSNEIPGFSVEEHTASSMWWTGVADLDPWEWRQRLASDDRLAYGKFFDRKAGFISRSWFPVFANYRRNGYDFDALNDDGLVPYRNKKIMDALGIDGTMTGKEIMSCELKTLAGFGPNGEKNYEGTITELQMQTYLLMSDFRQKRNKRGEGYGWFLAALETPETKWGYDFVTNGYATLPEESWERLAAQVRRLYPGVSEKNLKRLLGIRYPGTSAPKETGIMISSDGESE